MLLRTMPLLVMLVCGYLSVLAAGGGTSGNAPSLQEWRQLLIAGS